MTVRLANHRGRAALVSGDKLVDVEQRSDGRLPADPMEVLARWESFVAWGASVEAEPDDPAVDLGALGPCVPRPSKVFGIALNYRRHAEETGASLPSYPSVFTKFRSCLAGPGSDVVLPSAFVDWEVELVVVIGRGGARIAEDEAFDHIAGYCAGQDFSERRVQMGDGNRPQFSLGKSYDTFGPIGPAIVSLDAFPDPNDLALRCAIDEEVVQDSHTSDLIFSVPQLVAYLSAICTLEAGDLIFTGTPSGVGAARRPPRFLTPGEVVTTTIDGIGSLRNRCVSRT